MTNLPVPRSGLASTAGLIAGTLGVFALGANLALLVYGFTVNGVLGAVFFGGLGLLLGLPGLCLTLGARNLTRGDEAGARLARNGLGMPLMYAFTATAAAPFNADPEYRWQICAGAGVVTVLLLGLFMLLRAAESHVATARHEARDSLLP